jgi:1,4-alpha-glucan branching enzyme
MNRVQSKFFACPALVLGMLALLSSTALAQVPPLGATYQGEKTSFRVWVPFVDQVQVKIKGRDPVTLKQEPGHEAADTTWTGSIPQVKPGDTYQYLSKFNGQVRKFADPRSQQLTGSKDGASSVVVDPSFNWSDPALVSYKTPNFNEMVIYELHIGSFNPASGNKSFNFAGAIEKLDYLKQLGVNAIEVLPVHENPEFADHTPPQYDWGYDPVQLFAIESSYGTPQDFKEFVKQSHRRGIAVIVDVVYNHMSGDNLLKQFGGWSNATNPDGIYFYDKSRSDTGFGPRMDYGRSQVRSYIQDNALMYLREYQADGLRWDSTINIRAMNNDPFRNQLQDGVKLIREVNDAYRNTDPKQPSKISIAEDLQSADVVINPESNSCQVCLGFNSQWDDSLYANLKNAIAATSDSNRNIFAIRDAIQKKEGNDVFDRIIYSENHDKVGHPENNEIRLPLVIDRTNPTSIFAKKRSTLAAAILLTSPGIPLIFQGQEMLDINNFQFLARTPIDWTRIETFKGIVQLYHDLISLRRNLNGTTRGLVAQNLNVYHLDDTNKVLAYHRFDQGGPKDDVVVVANLSNQSFSSYNLGFPRGGRWKVRFNSGASIYDADFKSGNSFDPDAGLGQKDNLKFNGNVGLAPYSVIILSQD